MGNIKISSAVLDLVPSTDFLNPHGSDLLLIINGTTEDVKVGGDIEILFNNKSYSTKVLEWDTWFFNITNENLANLSRGTYAIEVNTVSEDGANISDSYIFMF